MIEAGPAAFASNLLSPLSDENLFIFQDDKVITGVSNQQDYYFEVAKSRKVTQGSFILLQYSHSPTLLPNRSTITVVLDGVPLGSKFLNEDNVTQTGWKLDLSNQELKPGFHKLSIKTRMEVSGNVCQDQNNEANWMILHKESVIHLNLQNVYNTVDLSWYPSPFLEKSSTDPLKTIFVVPDEVSNEELQALSRITQYFSQLASSANLSFSVYHESEVPGLLENDQNDRNMIFLGERQKWMGIGKNILGLLMANNENGIKVGVSPWNPSKSVMVITGNANEITNASILLSNSKLVSQLYGNYINTTNTVTVPQEPNGEDSKDKVTLEDLGYQDLVIESLSVGSATISYTLPQEWEVTGNGRLHLSFRHSKTLNFAQSLVVVRLNDVPVTSQYLTAESSDSGVLDVNIPKELIQGNTVNVEVSFQFNSAKEACTGNSQIGNWAVIDKSSYFNIGHRMKDTVDLQSLPFPFANNNGWNDTTFILSSHPSSQELSLFSTFLGIYHHNSSEIGAIHIVQGKTANQVPHDQQIIYVGNTNDLPFANQVKLPFTIDPQKGSLVSNDSSIPFLDRLKNHVAVMAMAASPFSSDKNYLVVAGTDGDSLERLQKTLVDRNAISKIQGQLVIVDRLDEIHSFLTTTQDTKPGVFNQLLDMANQQNNTVFQRIVFIVVFVVILAGTGFLLWRISKKEK
jgi:cellulose synthase operon protein B